VLIKTEKQVSSGFSFTDGEQILVSAQRPLGIVLEQKETPGDIVVMSIDSDGSAANAGVRVGDVLLSVQNASVKNASLNEVLTFIGNAPRVVNMRFLRQ
jgi:C-terminal processing protease CtpA/Prc